MLNAFTPSLSLSEFSDLVQSEQAHSLRCLVSLSLLVAHWHCNQHLLGDRSSSTYLLVNRTWEDLHYTPGKVSWIDIPTVCDGNSRGETFTPSETQHKLESCCGWVMLPGSHLYKFLPCCIQSLFIIILFLLGSGNHFQKADPVDSVCFPHNWGCTSSIAILCSFQRH